MSDIPAAERSIANVGVGIGIGRLVAGNSGFLFLSFAASALMNVLPQIFYARYASEHRVLWLSLSLFLSAIFSLLGNRAAQSTPLFRTAAAFYATGGATMSLCLVCAFQTGVPVPLYFLFQLVLAFVMACFLQLLDRHLSEAAGERHRHRNDLLTNLFRFIGMLLGPFWFWLFAPGTMPAVLGTLVFAFSMIVSLFGVKAGAVAQLQPEMAGKRSALFELLFLAFSVMVYATYCLLSASLAYLLTELSGQDAIRQATLFIVVIFASAVGFTAICLAFNILLNRRMMLVAPVLIAFAGHLLPLMLNSAVWVQLTACLVFGIGYGSFMLVLRDVLSEFAIRQSSTHFIAWFNNVPNYGSVLGFGLMAAISIVCNLGGYSFAEVVAFWVSTFAFVQILLAAYFLASSRSTKQQKALLLKS
jgi:hypothetical protein